MNGEQVQITTIWLGLKLPTPEPPIFETLTQRPSNSRPQRWTWSNLAQARAGHHRVVNELVKNFNTKQPESMSEPLTDTA